MNLNKLEIYGFKSFLDKTQIAFDEGVTAIVGPNGCGKSNVADAIRWVLGEQSAKTLRGGTMQDVIFNGTQNKKSLSYCYVSLFFNNEDKSLPLDFDEVVIMRKLYRSGESEYSINNSTCRLKDITDLMRQAQIGREGYSIIGQGRVEQFITLKPEERRDIFDEATGIAGSKQKKLESERKLVRTKENLVRYLDILGELERQISPLTEQAETAKTYLSLKEQLKYAEINNFIHKTDFSSNEKAKLKSKIENLSEELSLEESQFEKLEESYQKSLELVAKSDEEIKVYRDRQLELAVEREKADGENHLKRQRIEHLSSQIENDSLEISEIGKNLENIEKNSQKDTQEMSDLSENLTCVDKKIVLTENEFNLLTKDREVLRNSIENIKTTSHNNSRELAILEGNLNTFNSSLEYINSALENSLVEEKSGEIKKLEREFEERKFELDEAKSGQEELMTSITELDDEISESMQRIENLSVQIQDAEKVKAGNLSQKNFLTKMKESYEGFGAPVRKLLIDAKTNNNLKSKVEGVVANLMSVPRTLEIAIEASLGNAIQNVVTASVEDAKYLISYLKERRHGIVTFLPMPFVKPRSLNDFNSKCLSRAGVLGVASDLISYDKKYEKVMKSLLGAVVIVDNIDSGIRVAKEFNSAFKIVTRDGEILSTSGSISGGSYKPQISNILSHDREIAKLEEEISRCDAVIERGKSTISDLKEEVNDNNVLKANHILEQRRNDIKIASLSEVVSSISNSIEAINSELKTNEDRNLTLKNELIEITNKKQEVENNISIIKSNLGDNSKYLVENEKLNELDLKINEKSTNLTDFKVEQARIRGKITTLKLQLEKYASEKLVQQNLKSHKNKNIENLKYVISQIEVELVGFVDKFKEEYDKILSALENFEEHKAEIHKNLKEVDKDRMFKTNYISKLTSKIQSTTEDLSRIDTDLSDLAESLMDEYSLNYEDALKFKDENFKTSNANSSIRKLKESIANLGNVNVNAIEDLEEVSVRFKEMSTQRDDMIKAEEDLNKVIQELSTEMRNKFDTGFKQVDEFFQTTFRELFGGGEARLKLVENDNGDNLRYGVDIEAQPPGKALQNINLLSGGEKSLTAIAIIIAIMKLRPMPFCIFDEIESALDEINTIRFARYLQKFQDQTQFILVTHKKSTMEIADRIFGVTMQEKGVSKIVSVNLKGESLEV